MSLTVHISTISTFVTGTRFQRDSNKAKEMLPHPNQDYVHLKPGQSFPIYHQCNQT